MKLQAASALFDEDETMKPDQSISVIQDDNDRTHGGRLITTRINSYQGVEQEARLPFGREAERPSSKKQKRTKKERKQKKEQSQEEKE